MTQHCIKDASSLALKIKAKLPPFLLEHPSTPGFAQRYGIPAENVKNLNFIEAATLKPGASFVTRPAPGVGANSGGLIEVVVPPGGV